MKPAERGSPGARLDRLRFLLAGLAQVAVQVDQAGRHDAVAHVDRAVSSQVGADCRDGAVVADDDVA